MLLSEQMTSSIEKTRVVEVSFDILRHLCLLAMLQGDRRKSRKKWTRLFKSVNKIVSQLCKSDKQFASVTFLRELIEVTKFDSNHLDLVAKVVNCIIRHQIDLVSVKQVYLLYQSSLKSLSKNYAKQIGYRNLRDKYLISSLRCIYQKAENVRDKEMICKLQSKFSFLLKSNRNFKKTRGDLASLAYYSVMLPGKI